MKRYCVTTKSPTIRICFVTSSCIDSLKFAKPCAFGASGVHSTYISEPGAWAGSWLERQSQRGVVDAISELPHASHDLSTAIGYASRGLCANATEVEILVAELIRFYVSECGLEGIPREDGWGSFTAWVFSRFPRTPTAHPPPPAALQLASPLVAASPWSHLPVAMAVPLAPHAAQLTLTHDPIALSDSWEEIVSSGSSQATM